MFKIKKNKGLRGDVLEYVVCLPCRHRQAQARPQFDLPAPQRGRQAQILGKRTISGWKLVYGELWGKRY